MFTQLYLYSYLKVPFFLCGWEGGGDGGLLGCFCCFVCLDTILIWLFIGAVGDVPFHFPWWSFFEVCQYMSSPFNLILFQSWI